MINIEYGALMTQLCNYFTSFAYYLLLWYVLICGFVISGSRRSGGLRTCPLRRPGHLERILMNEYYFESG